MSPSSGGLGHRPFTATTRVRIPLRTPPSLHHESTAEWRASFSPPLSPAARILFGTSFSGHEFADRRWSEETRRFHASLTHNRLRVLVDREEDLPPVAEALARAGEEREPPAHLRLAPAVAAAILPFLPEATQSAGGVDGYGNPITETSRSFYRPSYRVRPVRMRFNLRLEHPVTAIDEDLPRAVALLAPADGTTIRVLIDDRKRVYPATVTVTTILAAAGERIWYPYGAGSFGAEMMF